MQVRKYECMKSFGVDKYDIEGNVIEADSYFIEKGSMWQTTYIDFVDCEVSLENLDKQSNIPWFGCSLHTLNNYFRRVE